MNDDDDTSAWRDLFAALAAQAMIGQCEGLSHVLARADHIAEHAYIFADKMIAIRERDAHERAA
jgi:hypothetical protein